MDVWATRIKRYFGSSTMYLCIDDLWGQDTVVYQRPAWPLRFEVMKFSLVLCLVFFFNDGFYFTVQIVKTGKFS